MMYSFAEVLPLAITMMAGPQIITAVLLVTGKNAKAASWAFVGAVGVAASLGTLMFMVLFTLAGVASLDQNEQSPAAAAIETALIALLIVMAVKTYMGRADAEPPKWMATLQDMEPKGAFKIGLSLIGFMPSDLMIMITVAMHLVSNGAPFVDAAPFLLTTVLVAALPIILFTLFRDRAIQAMPGIRKWMDANNWLIQVAVYLIFIVLIWK